MSTRYLQRFLFLVLQSVKGEKKFAIGISGLLFVPELHKFGAKASYAVTGTRVSFLNKKPKWNYWRTTFKDVLSNLALLHPSHSVRNTAVVLLSCGEEAPTCQRLSSYTASYSCGAGTLGVCSDRRRRRSQRVVCSSTKQMFTLDSN